MSLLDVDAHTHDGIPNDMTLIEGQWLNDELQGYGRCIQALGDCYTGYYQDGKRHGSGKFQWYNGDWYDGQWQDHYQHGRGIFHHHESGHTFFGYFSEGKVVDVRVNKEHHHHGPHDDLDQANLSNSFYVRQPSGLLATHVTDERGRQLSDHGMIHSPVYKYLLAQMNKK